jgi:hypothetical protein
MRTGTNQSNWPREKLKTGLNSTRSLKTRTTESSQNFSDKPRAKWPFSPPKPNPTSFRSSTTWLVTKSPKTWFQSTSYKKTLWWGIASGRTSKATSSGKSVVSSTTSRTRNAGKFNGFIMANAKSLLATTYFLKNKTFKTFKKSSPMPKPSENTQKYTWSTTGSSTIWKHQPTLLKNINSTKSWN